MVEGRDLAGEHGRMTERIAQHEVPGGERVGPAENPTGDRHRLPHVLVVRQRWGEMVHEGDAFESGGLSSQRALDDRFVRHAHLREEEMERGVHVPASTWRTAFSTAVSR
jgi:hypothetical protein